MNKLFLILILCFMNVSCFGQDATIKNILDQVYHEHPSVLAELYFDQNKDYDLTLKAKKSEYLLPSVIESFSVDASKIMHYGKPLVLSSKPINYKIRNKKRITHPHMVYHWGFKTKAAGEYIIFQPSYSGASGILDNKRLLNIHANILSMVYSGSDFISLKAGSHNLYLLKKADSSSQLKVIQKKKLLEFRDVIYQKLISTKKEDVAWVEKHLYKVLASRNMGISKYLIQLFELAHFKSNLKKNSEKSGQFFLNILKYLEGQDFYRMDDYFYRNFKDIYFKNYGAIVSIVKWGGRHPDDLLTNYIFNNEVLKTNAFIKDYSRYIKKKFPEKFELKQVALQAKLWFAYFYKGDFRQCILITDKYKKSFLANRKKGEKLIDSYLMITKYGVNDPKSASKLLIADSTEKISALRVKGMIKTYTGDKELLKKTYEIYTELKYKLINFENDFSSMKNIFISSAFSNNLFLKDFRGYCNGRMRSKIKKVLLKKDIEGLERIIAKFGVFLSLSSFYPVLFEEYFKKGDFVKAQYYANLIYKTLPEKRMYIAPRLKVLERINHTLEQNKVILPNHIKSLVIKFQGNNLKVAALPGHEYKLNLNSGPGSLIKRITLPKIHNQYTDHPVLDFHQGADVLFTDNILFITTASSVQAIDLTSKKIIWSSVAKNEYFNSSEVGPHQKRFVANASGNSLLCFTNRDHSELKTVKCFDFNGDLRWDLSGQSNKNSNPITTPFLAGDSLFSLSYNGSNTFKSINFDILNPLNGELLSTIPIGLIDNTQYDSGGAGAAHPWNTYRHDNHFVKDDKSVYGYTGTGVIFKASISSKELLWGKAFNKPNRSIRHKFSGSVGSTPSGYIKLFKNVLVAFAPDNQSFIGIGKKSGQLIWRSLLYKPQFIHSRFSNESIYFSNHLSGKEPSLFKVNPLNGQMIWQRSLNGLVPKGEGQVHQGKIYIPCSKSIVIMNADNGDLIKVIKMDCQPLKLRHSKGFWVLFTSTDAFLLKADGHFNAANFNKSPYPQTGFIKPEKQAIELPYDTIVLEKSLFLPEKIYNTGDRWSKNLMIETSLPYHHIVKMNNHITLFRESFIKKDGAYVAPTIMWYEELPYHFLMKDRVYIAEPGLVRAEDLFTRNKIWEYRYEPNPHIYKRGILKSKPVIAANHSHVAVQTINESIIIIESKTGKQLLTFKAPKARAIAICKNYVVVSSGARIYCYDIKQFGKLVWKQYNSQRYELRQEEDKIFLLQYNEGYAYKVYDLPTGKFTYVMKKSGGYNKAYREVDYKFGKDYSFAYYHLYDGKTGNVIKEYAEVHRVRNGGYFCFKKLCGDVGVYIENGKKYKFKTIRPRGRDNPEIGFMKKGNKIIVQAVSYIQTFEIKKDHLEPIHYIQNYAAKTGNHNDQRGLILYPLDNSLFELRGSQMFFFRNFDPHRKLEKIESFRVLNKNKSLWPQSELYPEKKVSRQQWIPSNRSKPKRSLHYLAFGDKNYSYLKFKISTLKDEQYKFKLLISTNSAIGQGIIQWNPDEWEKCSTNFIFDGRVKSWKEFDLDGNINLFLRITHKATYHPSASSTLPDFSIEMRQYKEGIDDGCYRIGGAFYHGPKFFNWNTKENNESQLLRDFELRNNIYRKGDFFPQGNELLKWVCDRRKIYSVKENIVYLKNLIKTHRENYCVINLLAVLLMEEIQQLRDQNPDRLEVSSEFQAQIHPIIKKVEAFGKGLNINKEWLQFALTIWTVEIYPRKLRVHHWQNRYGKSVNNFKAKGQRYIIYEKNPLVNFHPLTPNINVPYLEFLTPGLFTGYPKENHIRSLVLTIGMQHSFVGAIHQLNPKNNEMIFSRLGQLGNPKIKLSHKVKIATYCFNGIVYRVSELIKIKSSLEKFIIQIPPLSIPVDKSFSGLNYKSVLNTLKNLPSDSNLSEKLISGLIKTNKNVPMQEMTEIYSTWLKSIKHHSGKTLKACQILYKNSINQKNRLEFCKIIMKKAKVDRSVQRSFNLYLFNQFSKKEARSILGPFVGDLSIRPESQTVLNSDYQSQGVKVLFGEDALKLKKISKSMYLYVAVKVIVPKRKKVYFISNVYEDRNNKADEILSLWVNKKKVIDAVGYKEQDDHLFGKKITLNKGENIILMKFEYATRWHNLRYRFGDLRGYPLKNLKIEKIH